MTSLPARPDDVVPAPSIDDIVAPGAEERVVTKGPDDGRRQAVTCDRRRRLAEDHIAGPEKSPFGSA